MATAEQAKEYRASRRDEISLRRKQRYASDVEFREGVLARNRANKAKYDRTNYRRQEKNYELQKKYGITLDDYELMMLQQEGRCLVCGTAAPTKWGLHLDHCHDSGWVRGLLCFPCNAALGNVGDSVDRLMALAAYLLQPQEGTK